MSIVGLENGNFIIIDAIPLDTATKIQINILTDNGKKIQAILATHPFHTLAFPALYKQYPNAPYYGTPRHLRILKEINWAGDLNSCGVREAFYPEIEMRIPAGIFNNIIYVIIILLIIS